MVSRSPNIGKTLTLIGFCLGFIIIGVLVFFLKLDAIVDDNKAVEENDTSIIDDEPVPPEEETAKSPEKIDFQGIVDTWVNSVSGNRSVLIYDLERDETVGSYNINEDYNTASLYKLFVVYEGYRRIEQGTWNKDEVILSNGRRTVLDCLDLAIRESYSPCAETLWNLIGHAELDSIIEKDFGIANSRISGLISNVSDIAEIMKRFYNHPDFSQVDLIARMKDSFLNQPTTTYNWRQGLPSGFSSRVNVYNKVGWAWGGNRWDIYHDAAIVEFPEYDRHFIVVVMTNYVAHQKVAEFGSSFEKWFFDNN